MPALLNTILLTTNLLVLSPVDINNLTSAIYKAEGGTKTKHPYGVLSVKVTTSKQALEICQRTIRNNYVRWQQQVKQTNTFIDFLGNVYCPASADRLGNTRWKKNVHYFISHNK